MKTRLLDIHAYILLIACLCFTGCGGLKYQRMNDPERDAWQKPQEVITKLAIAPDSRIADLGAGGGYFTWRLAEAVGQNGVVYAADIDDSALEIIKEDVKSKGLTNIIPVRAEADNAKLPEPVDLVFSCDTYHHMNHRVAYFRSLLRNLKPGGRVAILDFHPHGFFSGFLGHGTAKEEVRREMESAGYQMVDDFDVIDRQHFQTFTRKKF